MAVSTPSSSSSMPLTSLRHQMEIATNLAVISFLDGLKQATPAEIACKQKVKAIPPRIRKRHKEKMVEQNWDTSKHSPT